VIRDGESGYIVPRGAAPDALAEALADKFLAVRDAIMHGRVDPHAVARVVEPFTPRTQLARVFHFHREIQNARTAPPMRSARTAP
jgi:hypothetical protein